jgi:hypothetical protein
LYKIATLGGQRGNIVDIEPGLILLTHYRTKYSSNLKFRFEEFLQMQSIKLVFKMHVILTYIFNRTSNFHLHFKHIRLIDCVRENLI